MHKINYKRVLWMLCVWTCLACSPPVNNDEANEVQDTDVVELTPAQFRHSKIQLGRVELKSLSTFITVNGTLDVPPQNLISVSAVMGGTIKNTKLLQGMYVKKGEVIATIQNQEFVVLQQHYLENKQKMQYLKLEYERQAELSEGNVAARKIFQQVEADYHSIQATVGSLASQLQLLQIPVAGLNAGSMRSIVNIRAPMDGYVTEVNINIGKYVNPHDVICKIVDTKHLHAELTIFEKDIFKVKVGQKIKFILVNEGNEERGATVYLINREISPDRTIRVHAHLDQEDPKLIPNMYLKAFIEVGSITTSALPSAAMVSDGDKNFIYVMEQQYVTKNPAKAPSDTIRFKSVEIKKGIEQGGFTQIVYPEQVPQNAQVVTHGAYDLFAKTHNRDEE